MREALRALARDEDLCDLQLGGTDGGIVCACRGLLAARSLVFRGMLFGKFSEAKKADGSVVRVGYSSRVLRCIVDYCHTDEVPLFSGTGSGSSTTTAEHREVVCDEDCARNAVALVDAANFFDLPELKLKSERWACNMMKDKPEMACWFLQEARLCFGSADDDAAAGPIEKLALSIVRERPLVSLLSENSVAKVSQKLLEEILTDNDMIAGEFLMFRILQAWASGGDNASANEARQNAAREMSKHVALERIRPSDLKNIVKPSGLVSQEQLLHAYETHAMEAEANSNVFWVGKRSTALWQGSESDTITSEGDCHGVEALRACMTIRSGVWKWSIKVEELCDLTWIGVLSTAHPISTDTWLGKQAGGWVYGSNGSACHATGQDGGPYLESFPKFQAGSVVTMKLDLRKEGVLSASIGHDKSTPFRLFTGMKSAFAPNQEVGFLPAVSLRSPGKIRLLGMQQGI